MESVKNSWALILLIFCCIGCSDQQDYSPKPRGFFRIEFPEKQYKKAETGCPFDFEMPTYAILSQEDRTHPCWKNLDFPQFNARLHVSYLPITDKTPLSQLTEDARTFAFKHTTKATAIDQSVIKNKLSNATGIQYDIAGNTASNYQFYLTDSSKHYFRAALYFNEKPHVDSIAPVLEFIKKDINHLIESFWWK